MTLSSLQALTWSTVTGAVLSALLLAAGETGLPDLSRLRRGNDANPRQVPAPQPPAARVQIKSGATPTIGIELPVQTPDLSGR
jgi:hypothetical protein